VEGITYSVVLLGKANLADWTSEKAETIVRNENNEERNVWVGVEFLSLL
jgi:hypothetical protein